MQIREKERDNNNKKYTEKIQITAQPIKRSSRKLVCQRNSNKMPKTNVKDIKQCKKKNKYFSFFSLKMGASEREKRNEQNAQKVREKKHAKVR